MKGGIRETSRIDSPALSKGCGKRIYLKPENMQVTGAYKIRGAYYKISTLTQEQRERGLVTASAGNHAQGVAYAAQAAGVPATIVMPTTTPLVKVNNTKDYGAKVILHGEVFDESAELAAKLAEEEGLTYIHPFNDLEVATGQGTIAYEIFQDLPDVDIILVPIGGGGLAAGVSTLAKLLNPNVKVIGVEPEFFMERAVQHTGLTRLIVTKDMSERKAKMIQLGQAFLAFPGGTGTLEEVSEVVSKICLNQLTQPCIFYNLNGFYDDMKSLLDRMITAGFSTPERQRGIYFADDLKEIRRIIEERL
mgnify:CR=1 FL=1